MNDIDFDEWLQYGIDKSWISNPTCATHEGVPDTEEEYLEFAEGHDPCQHVLRLWP